MTETNQQSTILAYCIYLFIISNGSSLPKPESPTQTQSIFKNPKNQMPKNLKIQKPEPDKTCKLKKFHNLKAEIIDNVHFWVLF